MKNTYGFIFLDIENDNTSVGNRQEQANLYTYMIKTIKENVSPQTQVGSIAPVLHNSVGYSRAEDYRATPEWLWTMPARHTNNSRQRGMPDNIVGKSFGDYADFQMPGTYYVYPDFDYSIRHNGDGDRHWLAALLGEQEVNMKLSPKKRIAWHWLFNTQSELPNSSKAEHAAPPVIAEGMGVFYSGTIILIWYPTNPPPVIQTKKGLATTEIMPVMSIMFMACGDFSSIMAICLTGAKPTSTKRPSAPTTVAKRGTNTTRTSSKPMMHRLFVPL